MSANNNLLEYEYASEMDPSISALNAWGKEGWELCGIRGKYGAMSQYYFKRPLIKGQPAQPKISYWVQNTKDIGNKVPPKIYISSKVKHAWKWIELKKSGINVISTWIDEGYETEVSDLKDLCMRCIQEAFTCDALIVYAEEGDQLKGGFIELGAAMVDIYKPIYVVGPVLKKESCFMHNPRLIFVKDVQEALDKIYKKIPS